MILPQHDYIFVIDAPAEAAVQRTASGIYIPTSQGDELKGQQRGSKCGLVTAVGPGPWNEAGTARKAMCCAPGDRIWYMDRAFTQVIAGEVISVVQDYQVTAIERADPEPVV